MNESNFNKNKLLDLTTTSDVLPFCVYYWVNPQENIYRSYLSGPSLVKDKDGNRYRLSSELPKVEKKDTDYFVEVGTADRLDKLAFQFYGNASYWWIIALANNIGKGTLFIEEGTILRIPRDPLSVESRNNSLNTGY